MLAHIELHELVQTHCARPHILCHVTRNADFFLESYSNPCVQQLMSARYALPTPDVVQVNFSIVAVAGFCAFCLTPHTLYIGLIEVRI